MPKNLTIDPPPTDLGLPVPPPKAFSPSPHPRQNNASYTAGSTGGSAVGSRSGFVVGSTASHVLVQSLPGYHNTPPRPVTFVEDEGRNIGRKTRTKDLDEGRRTKDCGRRTKRRRRKWQKEETKDRIQDERMNAAEQIMCSKLNYLNYLIYSFIHYLYSFISNML